MKQTAFWRKKTESVYHWLNKLNQLDVTLWKFLLLNMFRMLLHSSSGADDCMWVYCSVILYPILTLWRSKRCILYTYSTNIGTEYIKHGIHSYVYWTVHHLTSWINWTNLSSLYGSFLLLNMFRMLLHSSSGADDSRIPHPTSAEPHQYTSTHRNRAVHPHTVASSWGWM